MDRKRKAEDSPQQVTNNISSLINPHVAMYL